VKMGEETAMTMRLVVEQFVSTPGQITIAVRHPGDLTTKSRVIDYWTSLDCLKEEKNNEEYD